MVKLRDGQRKVGKSSRYSKNLQACSDEINILRLHRCNARQIAEWLADYRGYKISQWAIYRYIKQTPLYPLQPKKTEAVTLGVKEDTKNRSSVDLAPKDEPQRDKTQGGKTQKGKASGNKPQTVKTAMDEMRDLPMRPKGDIDKIWADLNSRDTSLLAGKID